MNNHEEELRRISECLEIAFADFVEPFADNVPNAVLIEKSHGGLPFLNGV